MRAGDHLILRARLLGVLGGVCAFVIACAGSRGSTVCPPATTSNGSADVTDQAALARSEPAQVVQRYFDAFNRADVEGQIALFSDDAMYLGGAFCQGDPCLGKHAIEEGHARPSAGIGKAHMVLDRVSGDTVYGSWMLRADDPTMPPMPPGAGWIRGTFAVTVKQGKMTRYLSSYDLQDSTTALSRSTWGNVVLSLQDPTEIRTTSARAIIASLPTKSAITVYLTGMEDGVSGTVYIGGTCSDFTSKQSYPLRSVVPGRLDTPLEVPLADIVTRGLSVTLRSRAGSVVACGQVAPKGPAPSASTK
jgi:hypothetical protein